MAHSEQVGILIEYVRRRIAEAKARGKAWGVKRVLASELHIDGGLIGKLEKGHRTGVTAATIERAQAASDGFRAALAAAEAIAAAPVNQPRPGPDRSVSAKANEALLDVLLDPDFQPVTPAEQARLREAAPGLAHYADAEKAARDLRALLRGLRATPKTGPRMVKTGR